MTRLLVVARNRNFPALNHSAPVPPRRHSPRGNLACSLEQAPQYDATAERWIVSPPGKKPEAGAAAELRHTHTPAHTRPVVVPNPQTTGRLQAAADVATTLLGMTLFGAIAYVLLVLA